MEWNGKWDWESLEMLTSKGSESPQKHHTIEWDITEEENANFNHGCSISASTDSPMKELEINIVTCPSLPKALHGSSSESLTSLKLGKRTYFENTHAKISSSSSSSSSPVTFSPTDAKKMKSYCQSPSNPRCQVEGCNLDLSSAKEYHRKHRVCETHSKSSKVIIRGLERRFCQQCSRFHNLSEFDEKKRSCRRRLSDHNARRRKPQHETIHFNSTRLCSSFYDERPQMSFMLNNTPLAPTPTAANSTWESTCTFTKEYLLKPHKAGIADHMQQPYLPASTTTPNHETTNLLPCKGTNTTDFVFQGLKEAVFCSNADLAPDLRRALSLLSTNTWGRSLDPGSAGLEHTNHVIPLASAAEYWQGSEQYPSDACMVANGSSSHFQEIQLFKAPLFLTGFHTNPLN